MSESEGLRRNQYLRQPVCECIILRGSHGIWKYIAPFSNLSSRFDIVCVFRYCKTLLNHAISRLKRRLDAARRIVKRLTCAKLCFYYAALALARGTLIRFSVSGSGATINIFFSYETINIRYISDFALVVSLPSVVLRAF